jgi:hypothetical protein
MTNNNVIKESFRRAKEDVEGVKNELAFALKRIAKIEELLNQQAIEKIAQEAFLKSKPKAKSKKKAKKAKKSKTSKKVKPVVKTKTIVKTRYPKIKRKIIEY